MERGQLGGTGTKIRRRGEDRKVDTWGRMGSGQEA
jgi:hypothetical protein